MGAHLEFTLHFLSIVFNCLTLAIWSDNGEAALFQHTRIGALSFTNGQCMGTLRPTDGNGSIDTFLVVIVVAFIFIKRKGCISTRIDA